MGLYDDVGLYGISVYHPFPRYRRFQDKATEKKDAKAAKAEKAKDRPRSRVADAKEDDPWEELWNMGFEHGI